MDTQKSFMRFMTAALAVLMVFTTLGLAQNDSKESKADRDDESGIAKRLDTSADVLHEIMGAPDNGIPDNILGDARCVAVVPSLVKFAIGIGGSRGKGVATCRTARGWSAPAPITITGGSW